MKSVKKSDTDLTWFCGKFPPLLPIALACLDQQADLSVSPEPLQAFFVGLVEQQPFVRREANRVLQTLKYDFCCGMRRAVQP